MALDVMLGWRDEQAVGKIWRFLSNFSAKNLLINSHQAHQIAAHPFHHLPMGQPDDNPSLFGDHCCLGCKLLSDSGVIPLRTVNYGQFSRNALLPLLTFRKIA
jgi:hypothetical protein